MEDVQKLIEFDLSIEYAEETCGNILNELYELTQKTKSVSPIFIIETCLTLVIKNLERNLNDQEIKIDFNQILEDIRKIDASFKENHEKN